jgi:hypothetical protein
VHRQGLADIREFLRSPMLHARDTRSKADHQGVSAGMLAAGPAWIAAVISGAHRQIARPLAPGFYLTTVVPVGVDFAARSNGHARSCHHL